MEIRFINTQHIYPKILIVIILFSTYLCCAEQEYIIEKNKLEILAHTQRFYFDILPLHKDSGKNFLMLSFSNFVENHQNELNYYQKELVAFLESCTSEEKDFIQLRSEEVLSYIDNLLLDTDPVTGELSENSKEKYKIVETRYKYNRLEKKISEYNTDINQLKVLLISEFFNHGQQNINSEVHLYNYNYVTNTIFHYPNKNYAHLFLFDSRESMYTSPVIYKTEGGTAFLKFDSINKSIKEHLIFTDLSTLKIFNALGEELFDVSFLNNYFSKEEVSDLISFNDTLKIDQDNTNVIGLLGKQKKHENDRPPLPYSELYYFYTTDDKILRLETIVDIGEHDEYLPTVFDFISPRVGDEVTFGKPTIYNEDKILYWYAIEPSYDDKAVMYVLACNDGEKTYYIDACLVIKKAINFYEVRHWENDSWVINTWHDRWAENMAEQILSEDTRVMPLIGLDAGGKIICYNPFRSQITGFELKNIKTIQ